MFKTNAMLTLIPHNSQSDLFLLDCYGTDVCKYAVYLSYFVNILLRIVNLIYMYLMYHYIDGESELNQIELCRIQRVWSVLFIVVCSSSCDK